MMERGRGKRPTDKPEERSAASGRRGIPGRREAIERRRAAAKVKKHVVGPGDTLSGLAKKYYGDPSHEKWMKIYEGNKEVIGDNPDLIRDGIELVIPDLDD